MLRTRARPGASALSTMQKTIIFLRHGEYVCNVLGVANSDPRVLKPLTPKGVEQATQAAQTLRQRGIDLVVTSEFLRARHTGALIAAELGAPLLVHPLANEHRVPPEKEGQPNVFTPAHLLDPVEYRPAGGESYADVLVRVRKLLRHLTYTSARCALVVTHGYLLQAARQINGEITAEQAALCEGMPGNCGHVVVRVPSVSLSISQDVVTQPALAGK